MARVEIRVESLKAGPVQIVGLKSDLRRGPLRQLIDRKGVLIQREAKRRAPVSRPTPVHPKSKARPRVPGKLKRSIYARSLTVDGLPAVEVGAKVPYLAYVLYPTPAHVIRPRTKRALAFWWTARGEFVVRRSVMHPGTRGQDFLTPSLAAGRL